MSDQIKTPISIYFSLQDSLPLPVRYSWEGRLGRGPNKAMDSDRVEKMHSVIVFKDGPGDRQGSSGQYPLLLCVSSILLMVLNNRALVVYYF